MFLFILGFFTASAQIHVSEGTSFVVKDGTSISVSSKIGSDSIQKSKKLKIYVKSENSVKGIADSEKYEIIYAKKTDSKIVKKVKNKSETKKEKTLKNYPKEEIPESQKVASFPVSKSCLSIAEGSVDAIVPGTQLVKKTGIKLIVISAKFLTEDNFKLKQNYFWIDKISYKNKETYSIRPPPVFSII